MPDERKMRVQNQRKKPFHTQPFFIPKDLSTARRSFDMFRRWNPQPLILWMSADFSVVNGLPAEAQFRAARIGLVGRSGLCRQFIVAVRQSKPITESAIWP